LGGGRWGWALGARPPTPNPHPQTPNPQSPIPNRQKNIIIFFIILNILINNKLIYKLELEQNG